MDKTATEYALGLGVRALGRLLFSDSQDWLFFSSHIWEHGPLLMVARRLPFALAACHRHLLKALRLYCFTQLTTTFPPWTLTPVSVLRPRYAVPPPPMIVIVGVLPAPQDIENEPPSKVPLTPLYGVGLLPWNRLPRKHISVSHQPPPATSTISSRVNSCTVDLHSKLR